MGSIANEPLIRSLVDTSAVRVYNRGQIVVYPNDESTNLYLIKEGAVSMETVNKNGERKVLYVFGSATLFPMVSFTERQVTSSWFYTALVDTHIHVIPYEKLLEKLKEADGFTAYNALLKQMLTEVHELLLRISDHAKTDSIEKLISIFLFFWTYHTKKTTGAWQTVRFPVTHQFLADMTGLTRETVTIALGELTKRKLIRYKERGKLELNVRQLVKQSHA